MCLSTSVWDNVQVAVLESLARGVPVVSTRVGDALRYYLTASLARWCVEPGDPEAAGRALDELAESYDEQRQAFAANGEQLLALPQRRAPGPDGADRLCRQPASLR